MADGRAALGDGRPVTLLSAPGAASFGGAAVWLALVGALRAEHPGRSFADVLDCADAPGRVLEALRLGQRALVFDGATALYASLSARAASFGATILPTTPDALDLSLYRRAPEEAARRLRAWLDGASLPSGAAAPPASPPIV